MNHLSGLLCGMLVLHLALSLTLTGSMFITINSVTRSNRRYFYLISTPFPHYFHVSARLSSQNFPPLQLTR